MFKITDAEKLRDAYTLLAFIRDTTTAEQKSGMAAFIANIKKEIRAYNNRPAPDSRIVEEHGIDGYIELVQLPNELDKANEDDAAEWFRENRYYEFCPTAYGLFRAALHKLVQAAPPLRALVRISFGQL